MIKVGKWIAKHKVVIVIVSLLLLIPSFLGMAATRVNYDILSYLPDSLETVEGQDIMVDEFGMGAFSMVVVENMDLKDVAALKEKFQDVDHVKDVLWYDSVADLSIPVSMIPDNFKDAFFNGDATMMIALFDNTTSSDAAMEAVTDMRKIANEQCYISGMSGVVTDIKNIALEEMPIYVVIAACLSLLVLLLAMDSLVIPVLFLISVGLAVVYNLGSNIFFGQVCYITKSLTAVLQLGVTMDYSIFLLNSFEAYKKKYDEKERAMAHAIGDTFKSVAGSSVTTIAGFLALCVMTFALGRDMGIVMAKGVVFGVIGCVTILPSMILIFDKPLEKTRHKAILPDIGKLSGFVTKRFPVFLLIFAVLLLPAIYGQKNAEVYYDLAGTLPEDLQSFMANQKLDEEFDMNSTHILLADSHMKAKDAQAMLDRIDKVDGVKTAIGIDSIVGPSVPKDMIPQSVREIIEDDKYQMILISSEYKTASDEVNTQIDEINKIVADYDENGMLIGEAPCTKDLITITDTDFKVVSAISIVAIFVIIAMVFRSLVLPIILVAVIEFAIFVNMSIPFYTHTSIPFIASIVIGTIQLGATVDYAILMTNNYKSARAAGMEKKDAVQHAVASSAQSIVVSALSFFASTFGVGIYSNIDMISSLCILMARGALISMVVVIFVLPAMYMVFDKVICATSAGFGVKKKEKKANEIFKSKTVS